ncbi:MAG: permease [Labilithrix sp.]|nr:permease [Labilithrix sp.]
MGPDLALPVPGTSGVPPVPRRQAAWTELALALGGFAIGTGEFSIMGLLPQVANELGVSIPQAGHLISSYALGVVIGAPVLAVLSARVPRHQLLLALMGMFALGNFASALAPSYGALLVLRFLTGVPHGTFFGVAALLVAEMAGRAGRARAVGRVMSGLTVACIVGSPLATSVGHLASWRTAYTAIGGIAAASFVLTLVHAPKTRAAEGASPLRELGALRRVQVWLTLGVGSIGFGGLFAVYTYLAPTMTELAGMRESMVPFVLAATGAGMFVGNLVGSHFADRALARTIVLSLLWNMAALAIYVHAARSAWAAPIATFAIGGGFALGPALQTRLMDVAADAQTLAASLNHSAFNLGNALGAWLGGLTISAGYGWSSTGWAGVGMALGGLVVFAVSYRIDRARAVRSG